MPALLTAVVAALTLVTAAPVYPQPGPGTQVVDRDAKPPVQRGRCPRACLIPRAVQAL
ncbi:hypothetical protein [Allokutzneria albata]|uniref:hypothetical protein n=1 Tax=Allokutzneria albata TaxID=211114 RepID=UPI0012DFCD50|nr:hypothetical protein [Allokutzneria albata]